MTTTAHEAHEAVYERKCDCAACVKDRARTAPEDTSERDEALAEVERLRRQVLPLATCATCDEEKRCAWTSDDGSMCVACLIARAQRDEAQVCEAHELLWRSDRRGKLTELVQQVLAELARVTDERNAARSALTEARVEPGEVERLRERVAFYELGNAPRLLGIAPDQLEAVRGVLRYAEATSNPRQPAVVAWVAAGRPLAVVPSPASEGEVDRG